jgi:hypothetical protein
MVSAFPPYIPYKAYFWAAVGAAALCQWIIVTRAIVRGKFGYWFKRFQPVWFLVSSIGGTFYLTIGTILFMGLYCNYQTTPYTLVQDPSLQCYGTEHTVMANVALIALGVYFVQNTILPPGTYKGQLS